VNVWGKASLPLDGGGLYLIMKGVLPDPLFSPLDPGYLHCLSLFDLGVSTGVDV
jgi:hypothetical protein